MTYPAKGVDGEMTSNPIARKFVVSTVLTDVTIDMVITKREPSLVAPLYRFKTDEDAITSSRIAAERMTRGLAGG